MAADNQALIRSFFEAADRARTPVELCTAGFTASFPGPPPMDLEGFDQFEAMIRSAFRTYDIRLTASWRWATTSLSVCGSREPTPAPSWCPASGRHFSVDGTAFLRIANGKVARLWGFLDQLSLMRQIGGLPAPGQAA
jgi:hypothetical protein